MCIGIKHLYIVVYNELLGKKREKIINHPSEKQKIKFRFDQIFIKSYFISYEKYL